MFVGIELGKDFPQQPHEMPTPVSRTPGEAAEMIDDAFEHVLHHKWTGAWKLLVLNGKNNSLLRKRFVCAHYAFLAIAKRSS
jgi:hypothetical protein